LPDATHAVRVGAIPDKRLLLVDANEANLVNLSVFMPTEGRVVFSRLERTILDNNAVLTPGAFGFQDLLITRGQTPQTVPPATDRILLVDVPGADNTVFYVMNRELIGWRLPLHNSVDDNNTNDVRGTVINRSSVGAAVGMLPLTSTSAWVAYTGDNVIVQARFTQ